MTRAAWDVDELVRTTQKFASEVFRPVALAYDENEQLPVPELRQAAELGLTRYDLPTAYGGGGGRTPLGCGPHH